ncbi:Ig-like domain-containing protein [Corallococcus sp. CA053C]|uniref:Ig-like domain-containing protein n=1 Tax=Corallococcus sp. CA053C TaxID=2316732 RepID=UPI001F1AA7B3|nr:Ig-like domain-containing protein [Corallococcus sp. CA053C]
MRIFTGGARGIAVALVGAGALAAASCGEAQVGANDPVSAPGAAGEQELRRPANDVANLLDDDVVPPTVELTSPATDSFLRGTVALTADASDDVGVARVDFLLDGATVIGTATQAPYTVNWNTAAVSGPHSLTAQAFDAAGNPGTSSAVSVLVDNALPIILTGPPQYNPSNQNYVRGIVNVGWAVTDQSLSGVAYVEFLQNGVWMGSASGLPDASTYYFSWDTRVLGNRSYTLTLRATDRAGNVQTSTRSLIVDNALPFVALTAPTNGAQVSGVVTLSANASDSQALLYVRFEVDGEMLTPFSTSAPFTKTWDTTGKSGTHQIVAIAMDRAGNTKRSTVATVTVP